MKAHSEKCQQRYSHDYDHHICETSEFKPHLLVYVARSPILVPKISDPFPLAAGTYNKLLGVTMKPFIVICIKSHTFTIDKTCMPITVSTDRVPRAPAMSTSSNLSHPRQRDMRPQPSYDSDLPASPSSRRADSTRQTADKWEYKVDRIARYMGLGLSL